MLLAAAGLLATVACSSDRNTPARRAYDDALNACEREQATDQRETCFTAARQKYEAAVRTGSSCPKVSC
jgi:hypothetical protein